MMWVTEGTLDRNLAKSSGWLFETVLWNGSETRDVKIFSFRSKRHHRVQWLFLQRSFLTREFKNKPVLNPRKVQWEMFENSRSRCKSMSTFLADFFQESAKSNVSFSSYCLQEEGRLLEEFQKEFYAIQNVLSRLIIFMAPCVESHII